MEIIVIPVHATGEYDSTMDCDYALVDAKNLRAKIKKLSRIVKPLAEKIAGFESIEIWDALPNIVSRATALELIGDDVMESMDSSGDPMVLDVASPRFDAACEQYERTEIMVLHFGKEELTWTFVPKHTTVQCETAPLRYSRLKHTAPAKS
jgi:hypothetical protein